MVGFSRFQEMSNRLFVLDRWAMIQFYESSNDHIRQRNTSRLGKTEFVCTKEVVERGGSARAPRDYKEEHLRRQTACMDYTSSL